MTAADTIAFTSRTRSRRLPDGGSVDRDAVNTIVDDVKLLQIAAAVRGRWAVVNLN
jgi:hypothetical protein